MLLDTEYYPEGKNNVFLLCDQTSDKQNREDSKTSLRIATVEYAPSDNKKLAGR